MLQGWIYHTCRLQSSTIVDERIKLYLAEHSKKRSWKKGGKGTWERVLDGITRASIFFTRNKSGEITRKVSLWLEGKRAHGYGGEPVGLWVSTPWHQQHTMPGTQKLQCRLLTCEDRNKRAQTSLLLFSFLFYFIIYYDGALSSRALY